MLQAETQRLSQPPTQRDFGRVYDTTKTAVIVGESNTPLFELYCKINGLTPKQGLLCLTRDLGIDLRGPTDQPMGDARTCLRPLPIGVAALPELLVPTYGWPNCTVSGTVDFLDETGRLLMRLLRCNAPDGGSELFPTTYWHRAGDYFRRRLLAPLPPPLPLLHLNALACPTVETVGMTDSPELAAMAQQSIPQGGGFPAVPSPPTEVFTSWYGGVDALADTDCEPLRGKDVKYILYPHHGIPREDALATAAQVERRLRFLGIDLEVVDFWFSCDPAVTGTMGPNGDGGPRIVTREELALARSETGEREARAIVRARSSR